MQPAEVERAVGRTPGHAEFVHERRDEPAPAAGIVRGLFMNIDAEDVDPCLQILGAEPAVREGARRLRAAAPSSRGS